jgi:ribosome-associated toxin RatA of RatAB toxin-antitoxin module
MRTSIGIDVDAPPARVFELARQVPRWAELLPHYRDVTVQSRDGEHIVARMSAQRPGRLALPVSWRAEHWPDGSDPTDLQLHFRHVGGATRGMQVVWHIRPRPGGASVRIEHHFERRLPILGPDFIPALIDRWFVRPIARRTLASFKALAEGGQA